MNDSRARFKTGLLIFTLWTGYGLLSVLGFVAQARLNEGPASAVQTPVANLLRTNLISAWIWAVLTPGIIWVARRCRGFPNWRRALATHVAAAVAMSFLKVAIETGARSLAGDPPRHSYLWNSVMMLDFNLFTYGMIAALIHAIDFRSWYLVRRAESLELETRASQAETHLARSRLEVLKMQLQPHFLFNTLHAVSELVHENPKSADRMITGLGDLLRMSLDQGKRQEVSLRQELEFLDAYLAIERVRFGDRLTVRKAIDPDTLEARVPHLLLQPLVENAIRHGIGRHVGQGVITIVAHRNGDRLDLDVSDDGRGFNGDQGPLREGVGLRNTRARLQHLYGAEHQLELSNGPDRGVTVHLTLPYRPFSQTGELSEAEMVVSET